jgi:hypothetical protein
MNMFLETMVLYPPVVSVAGFANVDRGLFRAVSYITKELECCKKQVLLNWLHKIYLINVAVRLDRFHWNIHSNFCQRAFVNGHSETMSTGYFRSFISRSAILGKWHYVYDHSIFCN